MLHPAFDSSGTTSARKLAGRATSVSTTWTRASAREPSNRARRTPVPAPVGWITPSGVIAASLDGSTTQPARAGHVAERSITPAERHRELLSRPLAGEDHARRLDARASGNPVRFARWTARWRNTNHTAATAERKPRPLVCRTAWGGWLVTTVFPSRHPARRGYRARPGPRMKQGRKVGGMFNRSLMDRGRRGQGGGERKGRTGHCESTNADRGGDRSELLERS